MADRLSTLDSGYLTGDLSVYPQALDSADTLYEVKNNAVTTLKQTLAQNSKLIIVEDARGFPEKGLLRIGPPPGEAGNFEIVYYGSRTAGSFGTLVRGFAGTRSYTWPARCYAINAVMAEPHNALRDAVYQIEHNLGVSGFGTDDTGMTVLPDAASLNGLLKKLEAEFLSPKPIFRAFPHSGPPPLQVRFQNYSGGDAVRFLWDFGDGTTSTDASTIHTYTKEGVYTVQLNIITGMSGQGICVKRNYVTVSKEAAPPFFYAESMSGVSIDTAGSETLATEFVFVDQTDGPIVERIWNFGDGTRLTVTDPDTHTISHKFQSPGNYEVTLLVVLQSLNILRADLSDFIVVS